MLRKINFYFLVFALCYFFASFPAYAARGVNSLFTGEKEYKIQKKDVLSIVVYPQTELNRELEVDKNGNVFFSFLGDLRIEGLSVNEFTIKLKDILEKDYLVNPSVSVRVVKPHYGEVVIIGQVTKPGTYPYDREAPTTLIGLVSEAGGFTDVANMNGTRVMRVQKGGEDRIINVKISRILDGKEENITLESGDIVVVPESFF